MRHALRLGVVVAAVWCQPATAAHGDAEAFGRNRPYPAPGGWQVVEGRSVRVLFPDGAESLAVEAARRGDAAAEELSARLGVALRQRPTWMLFPSRRVLAASNVPTDDLEEGIRSWTPVLRHRQVLVFESSHVALERDVRHAVVHAIQQQELYAGTRWRTFAAGLFRHPPDWLLEGMALYFAGPPPASQEVILRGASLDNRLLALSELHDFDNVADLALAYMEAYSAVAFIGGEYGEPMLGGLLRAMAANPAASADSLLRDVLGTDTKRLNKKWQRAVKKQYWPLLREKQAPEVVAKALHPNGRALYTDCVWSPSGEVIACVVQSARRDDVWLISGNDGSLLQRLTARVRGRFQFVEAHGRAIHLSADGDRLVFLGHDGARVRLFLLDVITGKALHEATVPLDEAFSPVLLPDGRSVLLVGIRDGQADLYEYALDTRRWSQRTDDTYNENEPAVHPDGRRVLFVREQQGTTRLFLWDRDTNETRPVLDGAGGIRMPAWTSDGYLFTADWNGTRDVYIVQGEGGSPVRLTNLLVGAEHPTLSPDGKLLAFTAHSNGRESVFTLPMTQAAWQATPLPLTDRLDEPGTADAHGESSATVASVGSGLLFDGMDMTIRTPVDGVLRLPMRALVSTWSGDAAVWVEVAPSFRALPDVALWYESVGRRTDVRAGVRQRTLFHRSDEAVVSEREEEARLALMYPLSAARRATLALGVTRAPLEYRYERLGEGLSPYEPRNVVAARLALVHDTGAEPDGLGGISGTRYRIEAARAFGAQPVEATSLEVDVRHYVRLGLRTLVAARVAAAASWGATPEKFYLGGHTSLRASDFEALAGSYVGVASLEFRAPLLDEVELGWPVRTNLETVRGLVFMDAGTAWSRGRPYRLSVRTDEGRRLQDLTYQYGVGLRARLRGLPVRFDVARDYDLVRAGDWIARIRIDGDF
jgi:Tol biopolymer transport system component